MIEIFKNIVVVLQILSISLSMSGVNVFHHICHHNEQVISSLLPDDDACSPLGHHCCEVEEVVEAHDCCVEVQAPKVPNTPDLESLPCCEDEIDHISLDSDFLGASMFKTIDISKIAKIDYSLPLINNLEGNPTNQTEDIRIIRQDYLSSIITYIHFSADFVC